MPRATRMTFSKRMVMNSIKVARFCAAVAAVLFSSSDISGISQYSRSDPYPVYTADSPMGPFTYLGECNPLENARISASYFRQAANKVGLFNTRVTYQPSCVKATSSTDVEIGDVYGPWNILGLFYPESNGNNEVQRYLLGKCTGCADCQCATGDCPNETCCTTEDLVTLRKYCQCPVTCDPLAYFGFMSVPVEYRKYGGRFQIEVGSPYGIGARAEAGIARVQQYPAFNDLTASATPTTTYPAADGLVVSKYIMNQFDDVITPALGLDANPYCSSDVDDVRISLWFCHAFEANKDKKDGSHMPPLTFTPYIIFECAPLASTGRPYSTLFSVPFGNDGHKAMGITAGFTVNFLEMFTMGLDGGVTHFSKAYHCNCPVPTSELQVGVFPRKANLDICPGKNFTFGATISTEYFWYNFSAWVEFRMINHCEDDICLVNMVGVPGLSIPTDYPVNTNVKLDLLRSRSSWSSSFANVGLTYDITDGISLGFFWQAPIRQRYAYRSTTLMGTIFGTF